MEVAVEYQRLPEIDTDLEDTVDVGLKPRSRHQYSGATAPALTKVDNNGDGEPSQNTAYLDMNGGAVEGLDIHKIVGAVEDLDMYKIVNAVQNDAKKMGPTFVTREETGGTSSDQIEEEEVTEEEVVELEFEKVQPKLDTHTMHCPNCDHHITKVVLRRKIIRKKPPVVEKQDEPFDCLGCFSCFSLFTSSDNGRFNPFPIFGGKQDSSAVTQPGVVSPEDGNCFSIFRVFRREKDSEQPKPKQGKVDGDTQQPKPGKLDGDTQQPKPGKLDGDTQQQKPGKVDQPSRPTSEDIKYFTGIRYGANAVPYVGVTSKPKGELPASQLPPDGQSYVGPKQPGDDSRIDIPSATTNVVQEQTQEVAGQDSKSFEILKSIVYGGLMEVIASLSIVASAAAGDATTLSIIALALANLIGGVFVIGHNIWDLRDDCYKFSNQQTSDQEPRNKYKELLGSVEHFPMHAFFAILSFLVFGVIPPIAYGYAFHETSDKDFTIVVVAVSSFVCVGLLAIFKAYIDRCNDFGGYVKTITYYLTTAVTVSGASYAAGNLAMRLIEKLGLFEASSGVAMSLFPEAVSTNPSMAYN